MFGKGSLCLEIRFGEGIIEEGPGKSLDDISNGTPNMLDCIANISQGSDRED